MKNHRVIWKKRQTIEEVSEMSSDVFSYASEITFRIIEYYHKKNIGGQSR
jgi:phenylpyruvate tautomerase PptA (4-oxalocrotonate tautomerase family)